jgi:hypothetical protein
MRSAAGASARPMALLPTPKLPPLMLASTWMWLTRDHHLCVQACLSHRGHVIAQGSATDLACYGYNPHSARTGGTAAARLHAWHLQRRAQRHSAARQGCRRQPVQPHCARAAAGSSPTSSGRAPRTCMHPKASSPNSLPNTMP